MPIYEYYCPDNHTIYQFYAKTLAQGRTVPRCPDNPKFRMQKAFSRFAVKTGGPRHNELEDHHHDHGHDHDANGEPPVPFGDGADDAAENARMELAMGAMEREFSNVDENDPKAMGRMMRRMSELTGEKLDGEMDEIVRKLEEGADPESLEEQFGAGTDGADEAPDPKLPVPKNLKELRKRYRVRRAAPVRDPQLYDYE
jgi:hypothetical protein